MQQLPIPILNPDMPPYAAWTCASNQTRMDLEYWQGSGNSVAHFNAMRTQWIAAQQQLRAAALSPTTYVPQSFELAMPLREISDWDSEKDNFTVRTEAYPDITPIPTAADLGPYVAPVKLPEGISKTGAQDQQELVLNMLAHVLGDTAALRAALKV